MTDPAAYADLPPFDLATPGPLRDELVAATLSGAKTTTSSLLLEYDPDGGDPLPVAGQLYRLVDSDLQTVAIVETTDVQLLPMRDITLEFAAAEGEGYESVAAWRAAHERYWRRNAPGIPLDDETIVVAETYRVVDRVSRAAR